MIGRTAAEKIAARPTILYQAATPDIDNAVSSVKYGIRMYSLN
jgi:hypothetical protein